MATVLTISDNGDGTSQVTIGTVNYGQAVVTVRNDALNLPETQTLYNHVADLANSPHVRDRRSRRDRIRNGD